MFILNSDNIIYKLGRNAKENFQIIDDADLEDWWFHLDDFPSGHCVVNCVELNNEIKIIAGNLVKSYSKLKNQNKVKIVYTQIKNVTKTKNIGEVKLKNSNYFFI